ncbi:hypothetical protein [Demequina sp. NBRC 110055]|uniref:hypothetical protein n=1 Tax=Demequina sp. NBRC 110055 TaxID=1570344 RepID=UPI00118544A4|nr:hypothetical protein [Demequina sp. NBRC 110055]
MNPVSAGVGAPRYPRVNLIPPEIAARAKMRAVRGAALLAIGAAIVIVVIGFVLALGATQLAESDRDTALTLQDETLTQRDSLESVYDAYADYDSSMWTLRQIGYGEIPLSDFLFSIAAAAEDEARFESITLRGPSAQTLVVAGEVARVTGVGMLDFNATVASQEQATALVSRLEALAGLEDVVAATEAYGSSTGPTRWEVTGSGVVTDTALSARFQAFEDGVAIDPRVLFGDAVVEPSIEPSPAPSSNGEEE